MASSLAKRLTYRITAVVLVMMAIIAGFTYFTVKKYMLQEAQERYEGVLLRDHEEFRRRLSNVRTLQRRIQEAIGMSPVEYRLMLTRDL